jgi:hypothetical protein
MQAVGRVLAGLILVGIAGFAQGAFVVTGTAIPAGLLEENYGRMPKGVGAYDLSICNVTDEKQSIVSSQIYQALVQSNAGLQPIGRDIMLAAILRNQNRSAATIFSLALNSVSTVLAVISSSRYRVPNGLVTGTALGAISGQQLMSVLKPVLSADQLEKFESQVLEPALVLDSGSCVERTVFTSVPKAAARAQSLNFHIR